MGVSFVNAQTGKDRTVVLTEVVGEGADSVLYSSSASTCYLPLKQLGDDTCFLVSLRDSFFAKPEMVVDTTYVWELDENSDSIQVMQVDTSMVIPVTQCRLTVRHSQVAQYISPECGCGVAHRLSEVSFGTESVSCQTEILNTNISNTNGEVHVQISW